VVLPDPLGPMIAKTRPGVALMAMLERRALCTLGTFLNRDFFSPSLRGSLMVTSYWRLVTVREAGMKGTLESTVTATSSLLDVMEGEVLEALVVLFSSVLLVIFENWVYVRVIVRLGVWVQIKGRRKKREKQSRFN